MTFGEHRHLRPGPDLDVVRLRTSHSLDWVVFLIAGLVGVCVAAALRPFAAPFPGALALVATWMLLRRTTIDRRRRVFAVHSALASRPGSAAHALGPLSVRKHVKVSKGTRTVTYEVLSGDREVTSGLPFVTADELAGELAEWLGEPRPPMPP